VWFLRFYAKITEFQGASGFVDSGETITLLFAVFLLCWFKH